MAVRKPLEKVIDDLLQVDIDKLISKGANVMEDNKETSSKKEWTNINLRIPVEMLNEINEAVKDRVVISRNAWILECIQKSLKNDDELDNA